MIYKYSEQELREAVKVSLSLAQVCKHLNITVAGGNYKTLKEKISKFEIDNSHFTGRGWNVNSRYRPVYPKIPLDEILVQNSTFKSTNHLKQRLYKEGVKFKKCECCGIESWNGLPIVFDLDHINGINTDHRLENLRILCPNCHSQTITYKGRNSKIDRYENSNSRIFKNKICKNCSKEFKGRSLKFCSRNCVKIYNRKNIPPFQHLQDILKDKKYNLSAVGRHYKVTDNAIRKWIKFYGANPSESLL